MSHVVFGVGVLPKLGISGYKRFERVELLRDVLQDRTKFDPVRIVEETLPDMLKATKNVPVFRYLRESGRLQNRNIFNSQGLDNRVLTAARATRSKFYPTKQSLAKADEINERCEDIQDILASYGNHRFDLFPLLDDTSEKFIGDLYDYLAENMNLVEDPRCSSNYAKLVCYYDWLKFGPQ